MPDNEGYVAIIVRSDGTPVMWQRTMTLDADGILRTTPYAEAVIVFKPADIAMRHNHPANPEETSS